jgi:SOS-response transcriptional repressor LexA
MVNRFNKVLIRNTYATNFIELLGVSMIKFRIYNGNILVVDKLLSISNKDIISDRIDGDVILKRYEHDL